MAYQNLYNYPFLTLAQYERLADNLGESSKWAIEKFEAQQKNLEEWIDWHRHLTITATQPKLPRPS